MNDADIREMRRATILRVAGRREVEIQAIYMGQCEALTANDINDPREPRKHEERPSWAVLIERWEAGLD